jgi:hypothetical protein
MDSGDSSHRPILTRYAMPSRGFDLKRIAALMISSF